MEPTPTARRFILHWGEMGTRWGVNRTVAQIHALLYVSPRPLAADEIAEALSVARSNVSTSLRELQSWHIVRIVHVPGDRRDHFASLEDPWEMFRVVLEERKRREVDPTLRVLRACVEEARRGGKAEAHVRERLVRLLDLFETFERWYQHAASLPLAAAKRFLGIGRGLRRLVGGRRRPPRP